MYDITYPALRAPLFLKGELSDGDGFREVAGFVGVVVFQFAKVKGE